jgi:hypothetical protein
MWTDKHSLPVMHLFYTLHKRTHKTYINIYVTECKIYLQKDIIPVFNDEKNIVLFMLPELLHLPSA